MAKFCTALALYFLGAHGACAFLPSTRNGASRLSTTFTLRENINESLKFDPFDIDTMPKPLSKAIDGHGDSRGSIVTGLGVSSILLAASPSIANAAGPDWGIFEGRTGSLLHPVMMASLLAYSLYTGFLGFQWRRQREISGLIADIKKDMPKISGFSTLSEAIAGAEDGADVSALQRAIPLEKEIADLNAERKELSSQGNRDKHFNQGALLAFLGTAFAIEGPLNTYARAGKLFPGPHLYAGAGLVVLWAAAAACVPAMQKGNDTARSVHIAANSIGIGLFGWQVVSGFPILLKVLEKTKWP